MSEIEIRAAKDSDIQAVYELYAQNPSHEFDPNRGVLDDAVVLKDGRIIAYGMTKAFVEAVLVLDQKALKIEKSRALSALMNLAIATTRARGISDLYTFTKDPKFSNLLKEQFEFTGIMTIPLVKEL